MQHKKGTPAYELQEKSDLAVKPQSGGTKGSALRWAVAVCEVKGSVPLCAKGQLPCSGPVSMSPRLFGVCGVDDSFSFTARRQAASESFHFRLHGVVGAGLHRRNSAGSSILLALEVEEPILVAPE